MNEAAASTTDAAWEAAYLRFETPQQEQKKFLKRLRSLGVGSWDRGLTITELFCGRGNGLIAWHRLGFEHLEGLDISADLVARYDGPARVHVGDARSLPFEDESRDVVAVQGGLHHLQSLADLERSLGEIHRVLKPEGRLLVVEPWMTLFLRCVHAACGVAAFRRLWPKLDALATMIELERETYERWLGQPRPVLAALQSVVEPQFLRIGWGKLMLVGLRRDGARPPATPL
jgi:ubiquinone/menaquinone biosynthesis C-methylase UbiE